ncbi:MAG: hypothetical protein M3P40_04535, partial [Actinomycetota bacterium]|nr:hypothetical protein [Actinomycetota bacterium]
MTTFLSFEYACVLLTPDSSEGYGGICVDQPGSDTKPHKGLGASRRGSTSLCLKALFIWRLRPGRGSLCWMKTAGVSG